MNAFSRLVLLGVISVSIFAALLFGQYSLTHQVKGQTEHVVENLIPSITAMQELRIGVLRIVLSTHETLHKSGTDTFNESDQTAEKHLLEKGKTIYEDALRRYLPLYEAGHDHRPFLKTLNAQYTALIGYSEKITTMAEKDLNSLDMGETLHQFEQAELAILQTIENQLKAETSRTEQVLGAAIDDNEYNSIVIFLLGLAAVIVVGLYLSYAIRLIRNLNRNELNLKENEQRFRDFAEASGDWFWETDAELRYSYFSARLEEVTGRPPERSLGKTRAEIGAPGVSEEDFRKHLDDWENHRPFRDFRHTRNKPDGSVVHLVLNGRPIFDEEGRFKGYRGTGADVTNQMQLTQELVNQTRIAELLENVATRANEASGADEALEQTLKLICTFMDWPIGHAYRFQPATGLLVSTNLWHVSEAGRFAAFIDESKETRLEPDEGFVGRVFSSATPLWNNDVSNDPGFCRKQSAMAAGIQASFAVPILIGGKPVAVLEFFDVDDASPDETLLQVMSQVGNQLSRVFERDRLEQNNRMSQQFIQSITTNLVEGILVIDKYGRIDFANPAAQNLLLADDQTTLEGRYADAVFRFSDCGKPLTYIESPLRRAIVNVERHSATEATFIIHGDQPITVAYACAPMPGRHGEEAAVISFRDISELKKAQEEALQASKLASVGELAAGIAHEINSPIQFIGDNLGFIHDTFDEMESVLSAYEALAIAARDNDSLADQLKALNEAVDDIDVAEALEDNRDAAEQSLRGVERIARIVQAMKEFSHPGGREPEAVDINHAIETTTEVCRNEWKTLAELELDLQQDLPPVRCFSGELNQVFLNLIVNASHTIRDTGQSGLGRITISTRVVRENVEIRVSDTGTGIPDAIRDQIFDPFFTTKEVGKGTGQGLAISRNVIVNLHGGTIDLETEAGKGTTFIIAIPIAGPVTQTEAA